MYRSVAVVATAWLLAVGCRPSSPPPETQASPPAATPPSGSAAPASGASAPAASAAPPPDGAAAASGAQSGNDLLSTLAGALGAAAGVVGDVSADATCTILYPPPDEEIAAQAKAIVPLIPGLTLTNLWTTIESSDDIECLKSFDAVDAQSVRISSTCLRAEQTRTYLRQTCRTDMRRARVLQTMVGTSVPETILGATSSSLSRDAFLDLKRQGKTSHRYIELKYVSGGVLDAKTEYEAKFEGSLTLDGTGTLTTLVNEAPTDLPVLRLSGTLKGQHGDKNAETRVVAAVVDDERFPLMLEYRLLDLGDHEFSVRYTKISYPTANVIEKRLAEEKRVDVYGIYFDFASDAIRKESEPVLKEIADALKKNAAWTLSIGGHTDSVGSDEANLDLSQRRSASVRTALVDRYGIAAERLTTAGYGEGAPKDTNGTPEGRARNRRVELVRQ
jgi:outer membrane protein OmpA-like peptidoglycan-associated protein